MEMFDITTIIVILVLSVILWFLFREVNCWYWKINERISLIKEQNSILKELLMELKNEPISRHTLPFKNASHKANEIPLEGVVFSFSGDLTYKQIDIIKAKAKDLDKGQLLSFNNVTHEVNLWIIDEYKDYIKKINIDNLSIVAIKE